MPPPLSPPIRAPFRSTKVRTDWLARLCVAAAAASVGVLFWIAGRIGWEAWPAIHRHGIALLFGNEWNPNLERFGILAYLVGTFTSSMIAIGIALPLGVLIAIFLSENFLPPALRQGFRFLVELLAAIPSVVYGLWGIAVVIPLVLAGGRILSGRFGDWVPFLRGPVYGNSLLTAGLVLALMILPTITAVSRNALQAVPHALREGGYALGVTRWETIWGILLPTAAPGIVASAILALGRAMGETMAVAMLIGNSPRLTWSLLSPSGTLASLLANQFAEAQGMAVSSLMYVAVVLMLLTLAVNIVGDAILRVSQRRVQGLS